MSPELKKKKTQRDRFRSVVEQNVSVLDGEKPEEEFFSTRPIEDDRVRRALQRNRNYGDLPLDLIEPDPDQVRKVDLKSEGFAELVESVREHGVLEPITVRFREKQNRFRIITGERRYMAARKAGLDSIPAILREISDTDTAIHQLVENLQRENMNPIEEARAFHRYIAATRSTQEQLGKKIGKSRKYVSAIMSLLEKLTRDEQQEVLAVPPAGQPGKSLILEACRTEDKKLRLSILRGEMTRIEARDLVKKTLPAKRPGRKKYASAWFHLEEPKATVGVTFSKSEASEDEILEALNAAVRSQKQRMKDRRSK